MSETASETTDGRDVDTKPNRLARLGYPSLSKKRPITELNAKAKLLLEYMVSGCPHAYVSQITRLSPTEDDPGRRRPLEPGEPLRLEEAADLLRIRRRRAREIVSSPAAQKLLAAHLQGLRNGYKAAAMQALGEIVEDPGDNSAAVKTARIKAATAILGELAGPPQREPVTVNLGVNLTPGLVIRLPAGVASTPLESETAAPGVIIDNSDAHSAPRTLPAMKGEDL